MSKIVNNRMRNLMVESIDLTDSVFTINIYVNKNYLEDWSTYQFVFVNRSTTDSIEIPYEIIKTIDETYLLHQLQIHIEHIRSFIDKGEIFDLSIVRESTEEEKSARIKSNYNYIELDQYDLAADELIHPFTTRQGNISFNKRDHYLFARIDHTNIDQDGSLEIGGVYHHPHISNGQIQQLELIVESNLREEELVFPLAQTSIPTQDKKESWYSKLKDSGFITKIDLNEYFTLGKANYFKFYLRVHYEEDGEEVILTSGRLKVNHINESFPKRKKFKRGTHKIRVIARPTRKSKFLSVRIAEYRTLIEWMKATKQKWVRIRRSKTVLNIYKRVFSIVAKVLPTNKKLVFFESFHGKQYSDSPRAIYEYMLEQAPEYTLVWSADRRHTKLFEELEIPYVRRFSLRWLFLMSRAKYWITNARLPLWIPKPRGTEYVQTWHGTPLKRLALDMEEVQMPGTNTERYKENFITESSKWDYLVSPNAYSSKIFKRAFEFNKTLIESGYPRNDYLYRNNTKETVEELKRNLDIPLDKQVILYAPTWRDNQFYHRGKYKFQLELDLEHLYETYKDTHVILFRMHYLVAENLDFSDYEGFAFDCSTYADIRDLYLISDMLITDYSSVFFDYANLRRPMFFFVYDIEDYRDNLRGFYFDFEKKAPGPLVKTTEELIREINKVCDHGFQPSQQFSDFVDEFCYLEDGEASKRVVETVFK